MKAKPGFYGASNISIKSRDACLVVEVKKTEQIKKVGALKFHDNHLRLCFLRYLWWTQLAVQPHHNDLE